VSRIQTIKVGHIFVSPGEYLRGRFKAALRAMSPAVQQISGRRQLILAHGIGTRIQNMNNARKNAKVHISKPYSRPFCVDHREVEAN
jgi:hypothetical protein